MRSENIAVTSPILAINSAAKHHLVVFEPTTATLVRTTFTKWNWIEFGSLSTSSSPSSSSSAIKSNEFTIQSNEFTKDWLSNLAIVASIFLRSNFPGGYRTMSIV